MSKTIGTVSLSNIVRGPFQSCHLGYKLDKDEINKGFMTEAVEKVINITFKDLKLHRIEANIMPKNKASLRVVEKLNFYNEGIAYKYLKINGKWEDHIHMVLLNEDLE
jgi:ribosomal-protein-alanine N-acetyltransferase